MAHYHTNHLGTILKHLLYGTLLWLLLLPTIHLDLTMQYFILQLNLVALFCCSLFAYFCTLAYATLCYFFTVSVYHSMLALRTATYFVLSFDYNYTLPFFVVVVVAEEYLERFYLCTTQSGHAHFAK